MNIINKGFLKLALLPNALYRQLGVNTFHLKAILVAKLTIDDRRPNTLHQTQRKKQTGPISAATIGTMVVSAIMGLIYLVSFVFGSNIITHLTFYFSFFFFMLAAALMADFTAVLIDVRDNYIILPKPVSDQTIVTARILHIFIHICKMVVPMCLPGLVYIIINYNALAGIYFLLMVLLLTIFVIFFINAFYLILLKVTTPAKFQSIISYIQIVFAILIYASYQILPMLMERIGLFSFDINTQPALALLPAYWFATGWNTLYTLHARGLELAGAVCSFVIPVVSLYVVIKYLAPSFNNKLAITNSGADVEKTKPAKQLTKGGYLKMLSRIFTQQGPERMGFLFTWKMTGRSRDFKVKVYPSIGYLAVIVAMMLIRNFNKINLDALDVAKAKPVVITALYIAPFLLFSAIGHITQSEKFKGSWIFFIAPLQKPGTVIIGALKATLLKFFVPLLVLIFVFGIYFLGLPLVPNIFLGLCNQLLITTIIVYVNYKVFPFSLQPNINTQGGSFIKNIIMLFVSALIGVLHYFIYDVMMAVVLVAILSATATWLLMSSIKDAGWDVIKKNYADS